VDAAFFRFAVFALSNEKGVVFFVEVGIARECFLKVRLKLMVREGGFRETEGEKYSSCVGINDKCGESIAVKENGVGCFWANSPEREEVGAGLGERKGFEAENITTEGIFNEVHRGVEFFCLLGVVARRSNEFG